MKKICYRLLCLCFSLISLLTICFMIHALSADTKGMFLEEGESLLILAAGSAVILITIVGAIWCHRRCCSLKNRDLFKHYRRP